MTRYKVIANNLNGLGTFVTHNDYVQGYNRKQVFFKPRNGVKIKYIEIE